MRIDLEPVRQAQRPLFLCSFGKDSSCLLHAMKGMLDKILVIFIDCGGLYPDIKQWAQEEGEKIPNFVYFEVPTDIWEYVRENGFPIDVVVPELGQFGPILGFEEIAAKHKVQEWTNCVNTRVWMPIEILVEKIKPDMIVSGERQQDRPHFKRPELETGGDYHYKPLWDWKDEDIWAYIDEHDIELPKTFQGRQKDRRDCWVCMGGHDLTRQRMTELRDDWPGLWHKLFVEEGFGELLPVVNKLVSKKAAMLNAIQEIAEEKEYALKTGTSD